MRASDGFDRMSTPEELHQVLAVLDEFVRSAWGLPAEDPDDSQAATLWADTEVEDPADVESLSEFVVEKPELKN